MLCAAIPTSKAVESKDNTDNDVDVSTFGKSGGADENGTR